MQTPTSDSAAGIPLWPGADWLFKLALAIISTQTGPIGSGVTTVGTRGTRAQINI